MTHYSAAASVHQAPHGNQLVIFNGVTEHYACLNETGAFIWEKFKLGNSCEGVVEELLQEYDAAADQLRPEVNNIAQELLAQNFLQESVPVERESKPEPTIEQELPSVCIITLGIDSHGRYSITTVVLDQYELLRSKGYQVSILAPLTATRPDNLSSADFHPILPDYCLKPDRELESEYLDSLSDALLTQIESFLEKFKVVIAHDLVFLKQAIVYNKVCRTLAAKNSAQRWLHWVHSFPLPRAEVDQLDPFRKAGYEPLEQGTLVSVSKGCQRALAEMYRMPVENIAVVHNSRDYFRFLGISDEVRRLAITYSLLETDVVMVYPAAILRVFKQHELCLFLISELAKLHLKAKVVFVDPPGVDQIEDCVRKLQVHALAERLELPSDTCIFTSQFDDRFKMGCSQKVMRDLFLISNVFFHPSASEACSLALLEAAMCHNVCIVNTSAKASVELLGARAICADLGNLTHEIQKEPAKCHRTISDCMAWYMDRAQTFQKLAHELVLRLESEYSLMLARQTAQRYLPISLFETELKILLDFE